MHYSSSGWGRAEIRYVFPKMIWLSRVFGKGVSIPPSAPGAGLVRNRISVLKASVPPHGQVKSSSFTGNVSKKSAAVCVAPPLQQIM